MKFFLIILLLVLLPLASAESSDKAYQIEVAQEPVPVAHAFYRSKSIRIPRSFEENNIEFFRNELRPGFDAFLADAESQDWQQAKGTEQSILVENILDWHAAEFANVTDDSIEFVLALNGVGLVSWHLVDSNGNVKSHKDDVWAAGYGRSINDQVLAIPIIIEPRSTVQFYLGSYTFENSSWPAAIWDPKSFNEDRMRSMIIDGLYFGLVGTLLFFCLVVFLNIREPVYLFFALFLLSSGLIVFVASGLYHKFLPAPYTGYGGYYLFLSSSALDFSASLFSILLLRLHQTNSPLFKGWLFLIAANISNTIYLVYIFNPEAVLSSNIELPAITSGAVALLELGVYIWTVVACWRNSKIAVYWFLVIFSHSLGLLVWTAFSSTPDALLLEPKHMIQLVTLFDAVMICGILAYSYRVERSERLAAQEVSVENLRIARDIEQAKANFVSTVSHDLHGPVRAIGFFVELLKQKVNEEARLGLRRIEENVETVSNLIDSLVKFSEGNAHRQLSIEETHLAKILYTIKNEYEPLARAKGIALSIPDSDVVIQTDPVAFSQVLRNLIDNAIKYTDDGTVGILLDDEEAMVRITVADTGRGISSGNMVKVFEEFYQVSSNDSEGVGLGLSIVARLTELLGIKVNVSSDLGYGSQFELLVPKTTGDTKALPEQVIAAERPLLAAYFETESGSLDQVLDSLSRWGVSFDRQESQQADLLIAQGDEAGMAWLKDRNSDQWVLLIGEVVGFTPPSEKFIVLPADVEPMMLRSAVQRILL